MKKSELKQLIHEVIDEVSVPKAKAKVLDWHRQAAEQMHGTWTDSSQIIPDLTKRIAELDPKARGKIMPWHKKAALAVQAIPEMHEIDPEELQDSSIGPDEYDELIASAIATYDPAANPSGLVRYHVEYDPSKQYILATSKKDALRQAVKALKITP